MTESSNLVPFVHPLDPTTFLSGRKPRNYYAISFQILQAAAIFIFATVLLHSATKLTRFKNRIKYENDYVENNDKSNNNNNIILIDQFHGIVRNASLSDSSAMTAVHDSLQKMAGWMRQNNISSSSSTSTSSSSSSTFPSYMDPHGQKVPGSTPSDLVKFLGHMTKMIANFSDEATQNFDVLSKSFDNLQ